MARLTGTTHPLLDELYSRERDVQFDLERYLPMADDMIRAHRTEGTSDASVVAIDGAAQWRFLGPVEECGHLAGPEYIRIYSRGQSREDVAALIQRVDTPGLSGRVVLLRKLVAAADGAAPLIEAALAVAVTGHALEWDTAETITQAARRLALDSVEQSDQTIITPRDAFRAFARRWGVELDPQRTADDYLSGREEITQALHRAGVVWGGVTLDSAGAAGRASVVASTWRAYVARGEAPGPDVDGRWRPATVDAWRMASARRTHPW